MTFLPCWGADHLREPASSASPSGCHEIYPPTLPSLCQGRAAPGTTLGVEQPTLAAPWPPCCPPLLHLAAPLGAPSRPRKLFDGSEADVWHPQTLVRSRSAFTAPPSTCHNAASLPLLDRGHPAAAPCCSPCCTFQAQKAFSTVPKLPFGTLKRL